MQGPEGMERQQVQLSVAWPGSQGDSWHPAVCMGLAPPRSSAPLVVFTTLTSRSTLVFEAGTHCTDVYYAFHTFPRDFLNKHGFYEV
jgi:hypothetical protein